MAVEETKLMRSNDLLQDEGRVSVDKISTKEEGKGLNVKEENNSGLKPPLPTQEEDQAASVKQEEELRSAKSEMGEVREENERLKQMLSKIVKDYKSLQTHFFQVLQQDQTNNNNNNNKKSATIESSTHQDQDEEPELISLSLGRSTNSTETNIVKHDEKIMNNSSTNHRKEESSTKVDEGSQLSLGLDSKFEPDHSSLKKNVNYPSNSGDDQTSGKEQGKEEQEPAETWPPSKVLKTMRSEDNELPEQSPVKKARVSVRVRCETPTMQDGCQWRKYGQKIAKGNPCPRAYYRCTVSQNCPVRKQVQRCADDMSILITTYEGIHNHPLSLSATAMASTTSAAVSMLQSRSSTSSNLEASTTLSAPISTSANYASGLLNFTNFSPQNFGRLNEKLYFQNSSISTSNAHPTVTLDLTNSYSSNRFLSAPRYPPSYTTLDFSSSSAAASSTTSFDRRHVNYLTSSWNNGAGTNYSSANFGTVLPQQRFYNQPSTVQISERINSLINRQEQQTLNDSIAAAATKVIASNPTFQSALAAAISSYVGIGGGEVRENSGLAADHSSLNLKL